MMENNTKKECIGVPVMENNTKKECIGVPVMAQWLTNPTGNHEVAGSVPAPCSVG